MDEVGAFLLADGTGAGKSPQIAAVAKHYLDLGHPVVLISKAEVFKFNSRGEVSGSFSHWLPHFNINATRFDRAKDQKLEPGHLCLATYSNLQGTAGLPVDGNTIVIFDEAHALKNSESQQAANGIAMAAQAKAVLFATATPADKPQHIDYLARIGIWPAGTISGILYAKDPRGGSDCPQTAMLRM
jgi:SNF2 family DNA or RNA helicase